MSDLEQRIKEAAARIGYADPREWGALTCAANILALLAEKDAEIERLKKQVARWKIHARTFADSLIAIEVKVFGNSDPINDDNPEEWSAGLLSDKVLGLKARAESAELLSEFLAWLYCLLVRVGDWVNDLGRRLDRSP